MSNRRRLLTGAGAEIEQIKNLPLGSKIKFRSGKSFILQAKNVFNHNLPNYTGDTVTLVSEFITDKSSTRSYLYTASEAYRTILPKYYEELTDAEKRAVIKRKYLYYWTYQHGDGGRWYDDEYDWAESYFWLLGETELGRDPSYITPGDSNLGFTNDASRIKKYENGAAGEYWVRYGFDSLYQGNDSSALITKSGALDSKWVENNGYTAGVVAGCDVKGDAYVKLKRGYWYFTGR